MAEKAIKSIRANPETFARLQQVAKDGGLDQGAALEALLNAWDVQAAKGLVPERAADVTDFDAHVQGIQSAFLRSLELSKGAEARARIAYQTQIDVMQDTVASLKAKNGKLEAQLEAKSAELAEAKAECEKLREKAEISDLMTRLAAQLETRPEPKPKVKPKASKGEKPKAGKPVQPESEAGLPAHV